MTNDHIPENVLNWIGGEERPAISLKWADKHNPADGSVLCQLARSDSDDANLAVKTARTAQPAWEALTPVRRGAILHEVAMGLRARREEMARTVALETGKSFKEALGETDGAIALGLFYAGEGQRFFGRTTTSGAANKQAMTLRQACGVAGLIVAANTPIANVAWKAFPALICGNAAIMKAAEDTPATALLFAKIAHEAGLPAGAFNVLQGLGREAGAALVENEGVDVISFTGSTAAGRWIAETAGKRLAKVSLELGGKNALVVCDDADLGNAVRWTVLSAFSNAGQRCASASRVIVFDAMYDEFKTQLIEKTKALRIGPGDGDDLGPVINERQLNNMLAAIDDATHRGAAVALGGERLTDDAHRGGYYMAPAIIENAALDDEISIRELFGPITNLYRAADFDQAIAIANHSPYGLTASIHTKNLHRAWRFIREVKTGVVSVNAGTHGSEPHMPFGGVKQSGNGWREPGPEAIEVYSELKDVYITIDPEQC
ncbi:MAG: aldehyde dehydrogenase family protein [bacterium]|nr:aldehyde dehydrogenase family protein [bacterium]